MKFSKTFPSNRYGQIVMIEKQGHSGEPEIRFFFKPDGYGVCDFAIGFNEDASDNRMRQAFDEMTPQIATEIIDGYLNHMRANAAANH